MTAKMNCFKAYDIRGKLGEDLNNDIAYRIGRAFGELFKPEQVVIGGDVRLTSKELKTATADGLRDAGVNVIDIGLSGTEEIYFATFHLGVDGGIEITASHNPMDYNGMKMVLKGSRPINSEELHQIEVMVAENKFASTDGQKRGTLTTYAILNEYVAHLMGYIKPENFTPLKLVVNSGNGAAGHVIDALEAQFKEHAIPVEFIKVHHEPDGTFPHGIPNPLLPECRQDTADAVIKHQADMGIAFDGDFDRCFLFDNQGHFIEGYYIVGLLAEAFLQKQPGAKIIHDPRLTWNTIEVVKNAGGIPVMSKTGHAFIKERMRQEDAIYGGEMSAHHYFRDFGYCDSGMIPWLLVAELLCVKKSSLAALVAERMQAYPCSGEINYKVVNAANILKNIEEKYAPDAVAIDRTDGLSIEMKDWRLNVRTSNTEPLLRLNIESKRNKKLVKRSLEQIEQIIQA